MQARATLFGQYQSIEPFENLTLVHQHTGAPLKTVDHEPKMAVLDQEDLIAQGIDTSELISGAPKVDALGSCTANATTVSLSNILTPAKFAAFLGVDDGAPPNMYSNTLLGEIGAITFYHEESPWPPTDGGSTGPVIVSTLQKLGYVSSQQIAHGAQSLVSLLQSGGILQGGPFLNAWMEPGPNAMVDGNGSASTLEDQMRQGVAGGHETFISAIEKLVLSATGVVEPNKTVIRVRNSWSKSFGDNGSFRMHLSTLVALGQYFDFRQLVA